MNKPLTALEISLALLCGCLLAWLAWTWPHAPRLRASVELRPVVQVETFRL